MTDEITKNNIINSFDNESLTSLMLRLSTEVIELKMSQSKRELIQELFDELTVRFEEKDSEFAEIIESLEQLKESFNFG